MMFTNRFIKVPISVHNLREKELTGQEVNVPSWYKFIPYELCSYRPTFAEEEPDVEKVWIMLKNGDGTMVDLSPEEFEELLNK